MTAWLRHAGCACAVNDERVGRPLRLMGFEAPDPKPRSSVPRDGATRSPTCCVRVATVSRPYPQTPTTV